MRKSFTRLLCIFLLGLMYFGPTINTFAQEPQSTVELYVKSASQCYNLDNTYTATVSVKDFINIVSFDWGLSYDNTKFTPVGVTILDASLTGLVTTDLADDGNIGFKMNVGQDTVSIGDNVETPIMVVQFELKGFPYNTENSFTSDLKWVTYTIANNLNVDIQNKDAFDSMDDAARGLDVSVNISLDIQSELISCESGKSAVTVTPTGGSGDISYAFNYDGDNVSAFSSSNTTEADAGSNTVWAMDENGCVSHIETFNIDEITPLSFDSVNVENVACKGGNGEITFYWHGGQGPYTYWVVPVADTTDVFQKIGNENPVDAKYKYTNFVVQKKAGKYLVAIDYSMDGCIDLADFNGSSWVSNDNWMEVEITEPATGVDFMAAMEDSVSCYGSEDGSIIASAIEGGSGLITSKSIMISPDVNSEGTVALTDTFYTFVDLPAGPYTITVSDSLGCTKTKSVTVKGPEEFSISIDYDDAYCGENGNIWVTGISGGYSADLTFPDDYDYYVAPQGEIDLDTVSGWEAVADGATTFNMLTPDVYYSVYIRENNGGSYCYGEYFNVAKNGNIVPIQKPDGLQLEAATTYPNPYCSGGTLTVNATSSGGTAPRTIAFLNSDGDTLSHTSTLTFAPVADTTLTIWVTDANDCKLSIPYTVVVPDTISIDMFINVVSPTCTDDNDGNIEVVASGGKAPLMYSIDGTYFKESPTFAVSTGLNTYWVMDANGCVVSRDTTLSALDENTITAVPGHSTLVTDNAIDCNGTKSGTIAVTDTTWNHVGDAWDDEARTIKLVWANSSADLYVNKTPLVPEGQTDPTTFEAGTYWVGAYDEQGCTATPEGVVIYENAPLTLDEVETQNPTCFDSNDGHLIITAWGGSTDNEFGGGVYHEYAVKNSETAANNLDPADWKPFPVATLMDNGTLTNPHDDYFKSVKTVNVEDGTYWVAIRDNSSCNDPVVKGPYTVAGITEMIVNTSSIDRTNISCNGGFDGALNFAPAVSGGEVAGYSFTISKGLFTSTNTTGMFANLDAGTYDYTITDGSVCNTFSDEITIIEPSMVELYTEHKDISCYGAGDGLIGIWGQGGTKPYKYAVNGYNPVTQTYDWVQMSDLESSNGVTINAPDAGTYYVFVTDANDCFIAKDTVIIDEPAAIMLDDVTPTGITCNGSTDGSVVVDIVGGWDDPMTTFTYQIEGYSGWEDSGDSFSGLAAGTYDVTVHATTSDNDTIVDAMCEKTFMNAVTIADKEALGINVTVDPVNCKYGDDGSLTIDISGGTKPYKIFVADATHNYTGTGDLITLAADQSTYQVTDLPHDIYTIYLSDANGCSFDPESYEVNEPANELDVLASWVQDVVCHGTETGKIAVKGMGGVGPYQYIYRKSELPEHILQPPLENDPSWSTPESADADTFDVGVGTWIVWVKDAMGCIRGGEYNTYPENTLYTFGQEVDNWRVQVDEPDAMTFALDDVNWVSCYGLSDGVISLDNFQNATGPFAVLVSGTDYNGDAYSKTYVGQTLSGGVLTLSGITATQTVDADVAPLSWPEQVGYSVMITDAKGCSYTVTDVDLYQFTELSIDAIQPRDGESLCPGDDDVHYEVLSSGAYGTGSYEIKVDRNGSAWLPWTSASNIFLAEVGNTYNISVRSNGLCEKSQELDLPALDTLKFTVKDVTCFVDEDMSNAEVEIEGGVGVGYKVAWAHSKADLWTNAGWEMPWSAVTDTIKDLSNGDTEGDVTGHYYFQVMDGNGCVSEISSLITFNRVQTPIAASIVADDLDAVVSNITGGTSPYTYMVNDVDMGAVPNTTEFTVPNLMAGTSSVTIVDSHGCMFSTDVAVDSIMVDAEPDMGDAMKNSFDVTLTFNRSVIVNDGDITVSKGTISYTADTASVFTVTLGGADGDTIDLMVGSGIMDAAGNTFAGETFTYVVGDNIAPTVTADPTTADAATNEFPVTLTFSEPVVVEAGDIIGGTYTPVNGESSVVVTMSGVDGSVLTLVVSNTIEDMAGNALVPATFTYTVGDNIAPYPVAYAPAPGTQLADNHPSFTVTFNEDVSFNQAGNIYITQVGETSPRLIIPVTSGMVSGNTATITYDYNTIGGLDGNTQYYVTADAGIVADAAGNTNEVLSDNTEWTFTTGDWATGVENQVSELNFKVYPNPFSSYVTVTNADKLSRIIITNVAGQRVKDIVSPTETIQLNDLRSGVYFMTLISNDVVAKTERIVKR